MKRLSNSSKVYATKAYTKGYVTSEPILVSSNGNFQLIIVGGIGINDTPYAHFEIKQSAAAYNAVVDIDLHNDSSGHFVGFPVIKLPIKYMDEYAYAKYGFSSKHMGNSWVRDTFIPILEEAVLFAEEVNRYFDSTNRQQLSEMCEDVFLDMGIDYTDYIQQEADSYL